MKMVMFVLCCGLFWSANAGFPTEESAVVGSGVSSGIRGSVLVGESSNSDLSVAIGEITDGVSSLSCDGDSSTYSGGGDWYYLNGRGSLELILHQSNTRLAVLQQEVSSLKEQVKGKDKEVEEKGKQVEDAQQEVSSLKKQVEEKDKEVKEKDQQLVNVVGELNQNERNLYALMRTIDAFAKSWSIKEYDAAKDPWEKVLIAITYLFRHGAKKEESLQGTSVPSTSSGDSSLNTITDTSRHDSLTNRGQDGRFFKVGQCEYRGAIDKNEKPNGKGELSNQVMKIRGTFREGFIDISKDTTFEYNGYTYTFRFPKTLSDEYLELISFTDISDMPCYLKNSKQLVFKCSDRKVCFIFSEEYVYVGNLGEGDYPDGLGVKFYKNGDVKDGKFKNGFFVPLRGDLENKAKRMKTKQDE